MDHDEIKQQTRGEAPSTFTYVKPRLDCPRSSFIAGVFCFEEVGDCACAVRSLFAKPKIHRKASDGEKDLCPFCYDDDSLRPADRLHSFHSDGTLRTHIQRMHSVITGSPGPVRCPYAECGTTLECGEHLLNHLATAHDLKL